MEPDEHYFTPPRIIARLQAKIDQRADPDHRNWLSDQHKRRIPVRGIRMQELRYTFHQFVHDWAAEQQTIPVETERAVALCLLKAPFLEDKLCAILYIAELLIPTAKLSAFHLPLFEPLFETGHLTNYKVCDNFALQVLVPFLLKDTAFVAHRLQTVWYPASCMWQARAALAALSATDHEGIHDDAIVAGCTALINRPEAEAKSIVGTALKALSKTNEQPVVQFLTNDENLSRLDAASLSKATYCLQDSCLVTRLKTRRRQLVLQLQAESAAVGSDSDLSDGSDEPFATQTPPTGASAGPSSSAAAAPTPTSAGTGAAASGPNVGGPGDPLGMAFGDPLGVGVTLAGGMIFASALEGHFEQSQLQVQSQSESPPDEKDPEENGISENKEVRSPTEVGQTDEQQQQQEGGQEQAQQGSQSNQ